MPGVWILGSDVVGFFAKCFALAQCVAGFCGVFYCDQVGFVLYYRCLPVNPSAPGVVLWFDMGIIWRRCR